jgi:hypothetical protein
MKQINKLGIYSITLILILSFTNCKTQNVNEKVPFTITEKIYFYWVGGKKGSAGTTIIIKGVQKTTNIDFPTIFFQNHEYKLSTEINNNGFTLTGNVSELINKDINMFRDAVDEYGNETPKIEKNIPFELEKNEAVLVYSINGKNFYHKITGIKQLEKVYYP